MNNWTEFHVAVVYYGGLIISLLLGVLSLLYLKPLYYIKKITEKYSALWSGNFITTVLFAGMLGAMSVSFVSCDSGYETLLRSPSTTIFYGLQKISTASMAYAIMLLLWLIILLAMQMHKIRPGGFSSPIKIVFVILLIAGVVKIYFNLNQ